MFVNDLITYKGYLYATDSMMNHILVFDVDTLMQGKCDYDTIPLPEAFVSEEFPMANGIEVYMGGLIVAHNSNVQLWYVDLGTHESTLIAEEATGDGLLVDGDILYSVEPPLNNVAVYKLAYDKEGGTVAVTPLDNLTSDLFRFPTTVAMYKDMLYLVNAVRCQDKKCDASHSLSSL